MLLKNVAILVALCLAVEFCSAITSTNFQTETLIRVDGDEQTVKQTKIKQVVCDKWVRNDEIYGNMVKLQQCLRQVRRQKLIKRQARSATTDEEYAMKSMMGETPFSIEIVQSSPFDFDKMLEHFRSWAREQHEILKNTVTSTPKPTSPVKADVTVTVNDVTVVESVTVQPPVKTWPKLQCAQNQQIKVWNATLSSQNYESVCWMGRLEQQQVKSTVMGETTTTTKRTNPLEDLNEPCYETEKTMIMLAKMCDGKTECEIDVDMDLIGICDCTQKKHLEVTYTCNPTTKSQRNKKVKRALHYRNRPNQIDYERRFRERLARAEGLEYLLDSFYGGNERGLLIDRGQSHYGLYGGGLSGVGLGIGGIGGFGLGGLGLYGGYGAYGGYGGLGLGVGLGGFGGFGK